MRWGILCGPSWYDIKTANQIIMACCLIHNYIRREMDVDPLESCLDGCMSTNAIDEDQTGSPEIIEALDTTQEWTT
ncbi:hypothetical protein ACS0TY_001185 [Phlomoides rotata]